VTQGLLLINKPRGVTSFSLIPKLRRLTQIQKIGHAGTLDPFATGLLILLIGKNYTRRSNEFLTQDKEYIARLRLGQITDTYDCDGQITSTSSHIPDHISLDNFQGTLQQIPPMYSAKKVCGKKLYELARRGISIERKPQTIHIKTDLLSYAYPLLDIRVTCSKGTYIRTLAYDIGKYLHCGAHLTHLERTRQGSYLLSEALPGQELNDPHFDITPHLTYS